MKSLFDDNIAKSFESNPLAMRAYTSRLLGAEEDLVLHGGGNTSVKITEKNFFGEEEEILYVKGSGYDLATIPEEGFSPVKRSVLLKLAKFEKLTDKDMVREQKVAMTNPGAPGPSVEAILHALIPFTFVDHTHADAVVTITNTSKGEDRIREVYGDKVLYIPYIMPGFVLARKVYELTQDADWSKYEGMILLNHGVFSFGKTGKEAYENMISLVSKAEDYLKKAGAYERIQEGKGHIDPLKIAKIRKQVGNLWGRACVVNVDESPKSVGFAKHAHLNEMATRGPITPDHSIHTKRIPAILGDLWEEDLLEYKKNYESYFNKNKTRGLSQLDPAPRYAYLPQEGLLSFGQNLKRSVVVRDIACHTLKCIQWAESMGGWKALAEKDIFDVEYWELEQAKLKKKTSSPEFEGKIALVTGAASGIGLAITNHFADLGACVIAVDLNPAIEEMFDNPQIQGLKWDLTDLNSYSQRVEAAVKFFGGVDIVVSNAGTFPPSTKIENMEGEFWRRTLEVNLNSHQYLLKALVPYLKEGFDPQVILMGSKNVPAPGPGASAYSVSKAGLTQLGRVAAMELGNDGIRVNIVHPNAVFDTAIWDEDVLKKRAESYGLSVDEYKRNNVLKTEITSKDVARLVTTLARDAFSKTTGAQFPIDGGNERVI